MSVYIEDYPYPFNQSYVQFTKSPYDIPKMKHEKIYTQEEVDAKLKELESKIIDVNPADAETVMFAELPVPSEENKGSFFNVKDAFVSDDRFIDGAGKSYPSGSNVIVIETKTGEYKFDVLMGEIKVADDSEINDIIDDIYKD